MGAADRGNKERRRLLREYGGLYRPHYTEQGMCFYCGDPSDAHDHCPPLVWIDAQSPADWRRAKVPLVIVQCCSDCNGRLGYKPLFTILERLQFLEKRLSDIFEKKANLWDEEEMREMSDMFKRMIKARRRGLMGLHRRIRFVQWRLIHDETHPAFDEY